MGGVSTAGCETTGGVRKVRHASDKIQVGGLEGWKDGGGRASVSRPGMLLACNYVSAPPPFGPPSFPAVSVGGESVACELCVVSQKPVTSTCLPSQVILTPQAEGS